MENREGEATHEEGEPLTEEKGEGGWHNQANGEGRTTCSVATKRARDCEAS